MEIFCAQHSAQRWQIWSIEKNPIGPPALQKIFQRHPLPHHQHKESILEKLREAIDQLIDAISAGTTENETKSEASCPIQNFGTPSASHDRIRSPACTSLLRFYGTLVFHILDKLAPSNSKHTLSESVSCLDRSVQPVWLHLTSSQALISYYSDHHTCAIKAK